jgi:hypothetical protein
MSYPTLYNAVKKSRFLYGLLKPVANWYTNVAGYRQLGMLSGIIVRINFFIQSNELLIIQ